ncbi:MAG: hypothetical protein ACFB5Z_13880 [Elainellaceae cyanobacterium]
MHLALIIFLAAVVLWVCGTLPWIVANGFLCNLASSSACPDPTTVQSYIRQMLALDLILIIMAGFAIAQLRQGPPRQRVSGPRVPRQRMPRQQSSLRRRFRRRR